MFDVCVIGHVTRDVITIKGKTKKTAPGGTAYYTGIACRSLGLRTSVVTKVAKEDEAALLAELKNSGVAVFNYPTEQTTVFENIYSEGNVDFRRQKVRALASEFSPCDLANVRAAAFHVGPLTNRDIAAAFLKEVSGRGGIVSIDIQGLLRKVHRGEVRLEDWPEKKAGLAYVDILKADEDEARILSGENDMARAARRLADFGPKEVIITLGSRGSLIFCHERLYEIPAFAPRKTVDPTGCGDTAVAGYLFQRLKSVDVENAGRFAAALATLKLERFGPFTGKAEDVEALPGMTARAFMPITFRTNSRFRKNWPSPRKSVSPVGAQPRGEVAPQLPQSGRSKPARRRKHQTGE